MRLYTPFCGVPNRVNEGALQSRKSIGNSSASVEHKATLKVLGLMLPFVRLGGAVNGDNLGCRWGVYLMIWTWRTAKKVRERRELGRREFHAEGAVGGFEERFVGGVFVGICYGGCIVVAVSDGFWCCHCCFFGCCFCCYFCCCFWRWFCCFVDRVFSLSGYLGPPSLFGWSPGSRAGLGGWAGGFSCVTVVDIAVVVDVVAVDGWLLWAGSW